MLSWCCLPQAEVESFYTSNGYLLPQYHQFYWLGYRKVCAIRLPVAGWPLLHCYEHTHCASAG